MEREKLNFAVHLIGTINQKFFLYKSYNRVKEKTTEVYI
jgi:hypothetical protein